MTEDRANTEARHGNREALAEMTAKCDREWNAAIEAAADAVRKCIPNIPHDGPSSPEQQAAYESAGWALTDVLALKRPDSNEGDAA